MDQAISLRPYTGWFLRAIVNNVPETTATHLRLDEEYWLALRHPAEIETAGVALLTAGDPSFGGLPESQQRERWREFRAYVRQAEGFYRGANVLPWKSSPLNHYYAFMNLAKALGVVRGALAARSAQQQRVVHHGLTARVISGSPDEWRLTVRNPDGVFRVLYSCVFGESISVDAVLDARRLLGYVSAIGWQIDKLGRSSDRGTYPGYWIVFTNADFACWDVIGIPRVVDVTRLGSSFTAAYEELNSEVAKQLAFEILGLHAVQSKAFRFVQRKEIIPAASAGAGDLVTLDRLAREAAPNCLFENFDGGNYAFTLGLPFRTTKGDGAVTDIPMNELVAAYGVMYFLSSLVRYHPDYMDGIGESVEAWLIESFAKSAPLTLLRSLVPAILGYTLIIESA